MPTERITKLILNDNYLLSFNSTPDNLDELAAGFLFSEGIISSSSQISSVRIENGEAKIFAETNVSMEEIVNSQKSRTSGCGKGITFFGVSGLNDLTPLNSNTAFTLSNVRCMMKNMLLNANLYREHGGVHCSALVVDNEIKYIREDIGRHNTVDKLIGRMLLDACPTVSPARRRSGGFGRGLSCKNCAILTTGRISFEMITKIAKAGIPFTGSLTAATDLAVDLAKELNIEIVGYLRAQKPAVYTEGARLK